MLHWYRFRGVQVIRIRLGCRGARPSGHRASLGRLPRVLDRPGSTRHRSGRGPPLAIAPSCRSRAPRTGSCLPSRNETLTTADGQPPSRPSPSTASPSTINEKGPYPSTPTAGTVNRWDRRSTLGAPMRRHASGALPQVRRWHGRVSERSGAGMAERLVSVPGSLQNSRCPRAFAYDR